MRGKKIIIVLIIINIILIGVVYSFIKKDYLNNEKIIVKAMTEGEYEDNITSLNTSHEDYANYIEESKKKIASAITDMGVSTSDEETLENMAINIRNIAKGYCFEPVSNFSISAGGTRTITPVYLTEVIGVVCTSTWSNTYGILFLKDAIKYDGSSLGGLKIPSHLNMSISFNNNNSVTLRNGDSTMGCSLTTCYLIGLI